LVISRSADIYYSPLIELIRKASFIHSKNFDNSIFLNNLVSVKTGACPEDCAYCSQSARYNTKISSQILSEQEAISQAKQAKKNGAQRICLSMSGKEIKDNEDLNKIISIAKKVKNWSKRLLYSRNN
jgi:biotin synthase